MPFRYSARTSLIASIVLGASALPSVGIADPAGSPRPSVHSNAITTTKVSCIAEKQAFASSADIQSTFSSAMKNVVGATLKPTITQGCLVVDFSGASFAAGYQVLYIQVLLDGTPMTPGLVEFSGADDTNNGCCTRSHAHSFIATGLSSGPHTIQVQFSNYNGTDAVYLHSYTLVAHYD